MPSLLRRFVALSLIAGLLAACGDSPATVDEPGADRSEIRTIDSDGFATMLESARGDVVLLNLWATWCAPCLTEIPDLVELEQDLAERGLSVIGISLDDAGDGELVQSFRDEYFPEFFTYHVRDDDWYALLDGFAPNWAERPAHGLRDRPQRRTGRNAGGRQGLRGLRSDRRTAAVACDDTGIDGDPPYMPAEPVVRPAP